MLWFVSLTVLLQIWSGRAACVTVGMARDDNSGIDFTVKTARCSTPDDKHFMVADQAFTGEEELDYCNSSDLQPLCPHQCSFLVRPLHPKAFFACVTADIGQCSGHNVKTPYPNPHFHICEACEVVHCQSCSSHTVCTKCFEGFYMEDGACVFDLDKRLNLLTVLPAILAVLLFIIFAHLMVRFCITKGPDAARNNLKAVRQGRKHRHFCKVQDWTQAEDHDNRRYPLTINVHSKNICGVGLGLYYNRLLFDFYVAVVCFIVTYVLDTGTGLKEWLDRFEAGFSRNYDEELMDISVHHAIWLGVLWLILFVSSIIFARAQLEYRDWLDSITNDMEDYVLNVRGLPPMSGSEFHEDELKQDLEKSFRSLVPDAQLHGVSVAYNYVDRRSEVEGVLANFIQQADIDAGIYKGDLLDTDDQTRSFLDQQNKDAQIVRDWFGAKPLQTTGQVFAVFDYKYHQNKIWDKLKENNFRMTVKLRNQREPVQVKVSPEPMDPPTVFWWALGLSRRQIVSRCACTCFKILIAVLLVAAFIFWPIAHFLIGPFAKAGNPPSAGLMLIAGIIMGIVYGQFFCNIAGMSREIGFHRKDSMDACIFCVFFCVVFLNAQFQMGVTLTGAIAFPSGFTAAEIFGVTSLRGILHQPMLVSGVYSFLMPGLFFMPKILEPLAGGCVPYFLNQLFAHIVYVWNCFPGPLGTFFKIVLPWSPESKTNYHPWNAELAMDPMEIPLPFVYADNMLVTIICFGMLMFVSDRQHVLFATMSIWVIFIYCFSRWQHLRFNKRAFFTTNSLDRCATYAWGIPLSVLAMSWSSWCFRLRGEEESSPYFMLLPFAVSLLLWICCYRWIVERPNPIQFEEQGMAVTYDEARKDTIYSWFNTNPVYVLKSHYCPDLLGKHVRASGRNSQGVCYFQVGKEYQCIPKEHQKDAIERAGKLCCSEIEWFLDKFLACLERCCCCRRNKLCCVINRQDMRRTDQGQQLASRTSPLTGSLRPGPPRTMM